MTQSSTASAPPLLSVENLRIGHGDDAPIVEQVSFTVSRGETVGLVGESGCGKSLTALSVMGLLAENLAVRQGEIRLDGEAIQNRPQAEMRRMRGQKMGMIFQEPLTALNPVMTIGVQITEVLRTHRGMDKRAALARAVDLLRLVKIPDPEARLREYPHQMSGGMRQRVVIAIAIACNPSLLIADEPTTALDVTVQAQILRLLKQLQAEENLGLLMITHDLGVVRQIADRIVVMYAGSVVEEGPVDEVLDNPRHPYTAGLIAARPSGSFALEAQRLADISGSVPAPGDRPSGCVFRPRCTQAQHDCQVHRPSLVSAGADSGAAGGHALRCHHPLNSPSPSEAI